VVVVEIVYSSPGYYTGSYSLIDKMTTTHVISSFVDFIVNGRQ
jgi:hypothetical protein